MSARSSAVRLPSFYGKELRTKDVRGAGSVVAFCLLVGRQQVFGSAFHQDRQVGRMRAYLSSSYAVRTELCTRPASSRGCAFISRSVTWRMAAASSGSAIPRLTFLEELPLLSFLSRPAAGKSIFRRCARLSLALTGWNLLRPYRRAGAAG